MNKFCAIPTKMSVFFLAILVLFLYTLMKDNDASTIFMGSVCVHIVVMIAHVFVYEICSTRQARVRTSSTSVNNLIVCDAHHHYVPSSEAFPARRRIQELRLQVALLDRELDDFENLTLGEFPSANVFGIPSMREEEINDLPIHNYRGTGLESADAPLEPGVSYSASAKDSVKNIKDEDRTRDELTCSICLEQVRNGDLVRSLPCLHQFHSRCIDPWLGLNASCPICKSILGSGVQQSMESEISD